MVHVPFTPYAPKPNSALAMLVRCQSRHAVDRDLKQDVSHRAAVSQKGRKSDRSAMHMDALFKTCGFYVKALNGWCRRYSATCSRVIVRAGAAAALVEAMQGPSQNEHYARAAVT